ncbi:MAG: AAA family ATPase [Lachnospirales bacterium]
MLKSYTIKNYKSFADKSEFLMSASEEYDFLEENIHNGILKGVLFVGANASGKSNAISALITLLKMLFVDDYTMDHNINFYNPNDIFMSFVFEIEAKNTIYEVKYEILHKYKDKINQESLYVDNSIIFEKESDYIYLNKYYNNKKFGTSAVLISFFDFLENSIMLDLFNRNQGKSYKGRYNPDVVYNDEILLKVNEFLKNHSFDFVIEKNSGDCEVSDLFIKRYKSNVRIPYHVESLGTRKLIYMIPIILKFSNETSGMLLLDEFGAGLHNELEELIIRYFMKNKNKSQIFATSHSTNLLKNSLFRPDQIYAIDINDEHSSSYERFSDQEPRSGQNLERMYLGGVFGGLPNYTRE